VTVGRIGGTGSHWWHMAALAGLKKAAEKYVSKLRLNELLN